eukprot:678964-Amorphochlora_amoeboformis.AAC.1
MTRSFSHSRASKGSVVVFGYPVVDLLGFDLRTPDMIEGKCSVFAVLQLVLQEREKGCKEGGRREREGEGKDEEDSRRQRTKGYNFCWHWVFRLDGWGVGEMKRGSNECFGRSAHPFGGAGRDSNGVTVDLPHAFLVARLLGLA